MNAVVYPSFIPVSRRCVFGILLAVGLLATGPGGARADQVVNLYSSRHYDTDEALYESFTRQTGIRINRLEATEDQLIQRLKAEGSRSPADVLITVDAGRLWRAQSLGLLQPVRSTMLAQAIPEHLREPEGHWFGFSRRARIFVVARDRVKSGELKRYEDLADAKWKGRLLIRSSTNVYNQSLVGALIAVDGEAKTEAWARAVAANFARPPKGGDTDQIRAVAAGEGDVAVTNSYYFARLLASQKPEDQAAVAKLEVIFPNQEDRGTHVNVSGAGVARHAPNKANAIKFLEYLASPEAQRFFTDGNYEFPAVAGVAWDPVIAPWQGFREHTLNAAIFGRNNEAALKLMDRAGWK